MMQRFEDDDGRAPVPSHPRFRRARSGPIALAAAATLAAAACGGSSTPQNGTSGGSDGGSGHGTMSGMAVKGPVNGGTMTAYAVTNGAKGQQIGTATTDAQGRFTMDIGSYAGPVVMEMTGGAYTDEATGGTMSMASGDVMRAVVPSVQAGSTTSGIMVTPLTSMAQARCQALPSGMTDANITGANASVASYFMVNDILHTMPMDPLVQGSGTGASQDARNYGMAVAGMSQYAHTLGMTSSSGIVTAMMDDASDGVMNGMMGSTAISMSGMGGMMGGTMMQPTAGTSSLATAMTQFMAAGMNKSGVTQSDMQPLIDHLNGSNGQLPGAGTGTTGTTTMTGKGFFGPVEAATVTAFAVTNGAKGAQLGTAPTDAQGSFTMSLGNYSGPVLMEMTAGTYTDEATGATMSMGSGDTLTCVVPSDATGATSTIVVSPLTSMAQARAQAMQGGMTDANVAAANGAVSRYFMVNDILHTMPVDATTRGTGAGATQDAKDYGMVVGAMSQYAKDIGMTTSSGIVTSMMDDAWDGVMNGMMGSTAISMSGMGGMMGGGTTMMQPTAGTSSLASAMTQFVGSGANKSGVPMSDVQPLVDKLNASNGTLQ